MAKCSPLHKVTDDARWDAEDLFGRLCILAHAAFLYAGFHPSGAPVTTPWSIYRSYSVLPPTPAAETESHQDDTAAAVVLRLYRPWGRRRDRAHMSLRAHVTANNNGGRYMERREQIGRAALETIFSGGGVGGAAREIRTPGSAGECLWKLLTDGICRDLFLYACEANGVPVMPDFASLHGDLKMAILGKLEGGKDVAMAECASRELRDLIAGHDSDLWKAKYEVIISSCPSYYFRNHPDIANVMTWKERYVNARRTMLWFLKHPPQPQPVLHRIPTPHFSWKWTEMSIYRESLKWIASIPKPRRSIRKVIREAQKPTAQRRAEVEEKSHRRSAGRAMAKIPKVSNRKEHQAGAARSLSSRYQQKQR